MKRLRRFCKRMFGVTGMQRRERELHDEIASHLALLTEDHVRAGMTPEAARRAARLTFGNVEATKENYRDARGLPGLESLLADIGYALRGLRKSKGFAFTAIGVLTLGIGSTSAIFAVVNQVLLKPLPFPDPDRVVILTSKGNGGSNPFASPALFAFWRTQTGVLEDVSAFVGDDTAVNYTSGDTAEQWISQRASAGFFKCAGVPLLLGRTFSEEEDSPNGPRVVVLDRDLWLRRFAGDRSILGRTIGLNGMPYTVIGVVAESPGLREFGALPEVFLPTRLDPASRDLGSYFFVMARLKPGVTLEQAKARIEASSSEFRAKFPEGLGPDGKLTAGLVSEFLTGYIRPVLLIFMGAVGLVLLIACANIASLLLARGAVRRREIGIRAAIGASRGRIVRQLLTESVLLALAGGALGLPLGHAGIRALLARTDSGYLLSGDNGSALAPDWRVLAFALTLSLGTAVVFGLLPAVRVSRVDLNSFLKHEGTLARRNRARAALVVSQVSLAVILLIGSALLIRTFLELYRVDRGFETQNVMTMHTLLGGPKYATSAGVADTVRIGLERIRAIPGVNAAGAGGQVPLQGGSGLPFVILGRPDSATSAGWDTVAPGYFDVFKIPLKRGRVLNNSDTGAATPVMVISETMAKQFWKDGDPLKDRVQIGRGVMAVMANEPPRQIVGIVGDVRDAGLNREPRPVMYVPQAQIPDAFTQAFVRDAFINWVVRTRTDARRLAPVIQKQLQEATGLPVSGLLMMDQVVAQSIDQQRFSLWLMSAFGAVALLLAAMGIYGLMSYAVEQRRREFGIRLALGAEAAAVRRMILREGMALVSMGAAIGLAGAWALARTLESFLFGVKARDPLVFVAAPLVLGAVALWASWFPALRSSRVEPITALRYE